MKPLHFVKEASDVPMQARTEQQLHTSNQARDTGQVDPETVSQSILSVNGNSLRYYRI